MFAMLGSSSLADVPLHSAMHQAERVKNHDDPSVGMLAGEEKAEGSLGFLFCTSL